MASNYNTCNCRLNKIVKKANPKANCIYLGNSFETSSVVLVPCFFLVLGCIKNTV